ncbi:MAG: hypothetical protein ABTQ31_12770 [Rhizobiaceae bacterium]
MGFTPEQVGSMSVWRFMAALSGYIASNSTDDDKGLSIKEQDELADWMGI